MKTTAALLSLACLPAIACLTHNHARAQEAAADSPGKFTLRYKLSPGETLYWTVEHRARIRSTVAGSTQTAETASDSVKVWEVKQADAQGQVTFVHSVQSVRMRHKSSGREESFFDSRSDKDPPLGFEDAARDVGVPLTQVTMDATGNIVQRKDLRNVPKGSTSGYEGPMTLPLPKEPVAPGGQWDFTHTVHVPCRDGTVKRVRLQQRFTLEGVSGGIATIHVDSVILTPLTDPDVKAQLVQSKTHGKVKFDLEAGRVVEQNLKLDEHVVGAPAGDTSSMHYVMQFVERYEPKPPSTAQQPKVAGPQPK